MRRKRINQNSVQRTHRLTDFPLPGWIGFLIRFFKTFEVLFFKLLQWLDLYRPQKSVVGVPGFASRGIAVFQAIVYNGTQDEVLGYRPRRLMHRLFKGLPDVEMYERLRFQLALTPKALRTVEASTETRGFVNLVLPWQVSWDLPNLAWQRIRPLGVETLTGRVELGDYEVISAPVFFLDERVKWVVISDIDDTIKDSRIGETTGLGAILKAVFRGHYYGYEAIEGMAELYRDLAAKGALIFYVTSTPFQLGPFLLKFLRDADFPMGPVFMRWLGYNRFGHKVRTLRRILNNVEQQRCVLVGDSGEQDLQIYRRVCESSLFGGHVEKTLIRHIPGTPLVDRVDARENHYKSIEELRDQLDFILKSDT